MDNPGRYPTVDESLDRLRWAGQGVRDFRRRGVYRLLHSAQNKLNAEDPSRVPVT
jgi:hypothetical protein